MVNKMNPTKNKRINWNLTSISEQLDTPESGCFKKIQVLINQRRHIVIMNAKFEEVIHTRGNISDHFANPSAKLPFRLFYFSSFGAKQLK